MSAFFRRWFACMAALGTLAIGSAAQMVSPEIDDQPGPFSYFSQSTDEIGIPYAESGTEITPEGSLYTGYGELLFFVGPELTPLTARVRTLNSVIRRPRTPIGTSRGVVAPVCQAEAQISYL